MRRKALIFKQWLSGHSTICDSELGDYAKAYKQVYCNK
jgi:hypothetical protein